MPSIAGFYFLFHRADVVLTLQRGGQELDGSIFTKSNDNNTPSVSSCRTHITLNRSEGNSDF